MIHLAFRIYGPGNYGDVDVALELPRGALPDRKDTEADLSLINLLAGVVQSAIEAQLSDLVEQSAKLGEQ